MAFHMPMEYIHMNHLIDINLMKHTPLLKKNYNSNIIMFNSTFTGNKTGNRNQARYIVNMGYLNLHEKRL